MVTLPFGEFQNISPAMGIPDANQVLFPVMNIYDKEGRLDFSGSDEQQNLAIIRSLVQTGKAPLLKPSQLSLASLLAQHSPTIDRAMRNLPKKNTVLIVNLNGCHGCELEDKGLMQMQPSLSQKGWNVVTLQVVPRAPKTRKPNMDVSQ